MPSTLCSTIFAFLPWQPLFAHPSALSWSTKLTSTLLTPRKIAWVLLLAGIAYFIHISPKTPIEFFDAAVRDEEVVRQYRMKKFDMIDPVGAAAVRKSEELISCHRRMERLALLYDIANNPQRVDEERFSIAEGSYFSDESTEATLRANDESYRALAQQFDVCKKEYNKDQNLVRVANGVVAKAESDRGFGEAVFRIEMERCMLRHFQAWLFWRRTR